MPCMLLAQQFNNQSQCYIVFHRVWTSQILNQYLSMGYPILWPSFTRGVVSNVYKFIHKLTHLLPHVIVQLCGCASQSGQPSIAHLFHARQQKFKDELLQSYCKGRENCLQVTLECGIGSSESLQQNNFVVTYAHGRSVQKSQKQSLAHDMSPSHVKELKTKLSEEHEKMLLEHPSYRMIGIDRVPRHCT